MAKRDPEKSARNRIIAKIKEELRTLLPAVLAETGVVSELSLNAKIGSKHDEFFDLKNVVILSQDEFTNKWLLGLKVAANTYNSDAYTWILDSLKNSVTFKKYLFLFLKRSYLKRFDEFSKNRPKSSESILWIGQENANYGLLVTPRFQNGVWENDKSEIRKFDHGYWTIGHVLKTGLVIPGKDKVFKFNDLEQYLLFFTDTLVRNSGSKYEYIIAEQYANFVRKAKHPYDVPLMIPEFRYLGLEKKHIHRLDFLVINPYTLNKYGIELSPWSTHGYLEKTKDLTQKKINEIAKGKFEKEAKKLRDYFKRHGIYTLIYTDEQLTDCEALFKDEIVPLLKTEKPSNQLSFQIMEEFDD
ncbi:hypothetical protein [Pantoea agglomerans]|uniref:hypothetical protein n=1 Tax=Enterobacter agglomerans TaxID=549 RepID=UPI00026D24F7|nr:hypothetical protein [Pantoea agglomerans]